MTYIGAIFTSTYHTKQLNPWPYSSASYVVNYSQLSACQLAMEPSKDHPSTRESLTSERNNLANFQHQYLPELLVNVYSYLLMVKSVSCCCVCGRRLFSVQVTYMCKSHICVCVYHIYPSRSLGVYFL